ncbi:MAG: hypothetical protein HKN54_01600 [Flavobacteriaceae bacterium]|nr:hypothetical protein [Flavobacteriaceae bacterium]
MQKIAKFFLVLLLFSSGTDAQNLYLTIEGSDTLETAVIDSLRYSKIFQDFKSLQNEIDSTHFKLQRAGYIENEVLKTSKFNDSTYQSEFALNKKYDTIYIYYSKTHFSEAQLQAVSNAVTPDYFSIPISEIEKVMNYLNALIIEQGLPFASLKLTGHKKKDGKNLQANLLISENKKRTVDALVIKGYEKFPRSFLKHYLKVRSGDDFNLNEIKEKTERLNNLNFANQTRSPEVLFTKDSTTIYFYIEKIKSNSFDGFLGFGTNEETNKLEFDGYLNLNLINSLNFGESVRLNYKSDENEQKTFNVQADMPYLFRTGLGTQVHLNIFKKDSSFTTVNQSADLFYQLNATQRLFVGISAVQSNNLLSENTGDIQDYNTTFYNLKYEQFKPQFQNLLFPVNFRFFAKFGFGQRHLQNDTEAQQSFALDVSKIINLNPKNSIYLKASGAGLFTDNLLSNELLRFGGINSIRGFEENSLLSSVYGVFNSEYRYQLNNSIFIHSIIDAAYLENDLALTKEKLFGFGFGFGILTKAGLLKFNYANGKFENQKFKLSNSKIHLSLNASF